MHYEVKGYFVSLAHMSICLIVQNRQIAQNATLSKIFTAHIALAFSRVCLLGPPTPTRDIYIPIGWRPFTAEILLAHLHRVELFSTLIYSFTALKLSLKRSLQSLYRTCLIESEWAFIAQNALQLLV